MSKLIQRREAVLKFIETNVIASPAVIAANFKVSVETVRRDLVSLKKEGLIKTVHGGVAATKQRGVEMPYRTRASKYVQEKQNIANAAVKLIKPGDSLVLGGGTTVFELAKKLITVKDLLVVTPSTEIASYLVANSSHRVFLLGGWLRNEDWSVFGSRTVETMLSFHVDKSFMSAAGISVECGATDYFDEEVNLRNAEMKSAQDSILLVDHSKFTTTALLSVAPVTAFSTIITDDKAPKDEINRMIEMDIETIIATENLGG